MLIILRMSQEADTLRKRITALEAQCRRQQAEIGTLQASLRTERAASAAKDIEIERLRRELAQERLAHKATKDSLQSLLQSVQTLDERFRALLRRQFGASSERACADQLVIPEIATDLEALQELTSAAATLLPASTTPEGEAPLTTANASQTDAAVAAAPAVAAASAPSHEGKKRQRPANAGGRDPLPEDLPREDITYEPPADHPALKHALRTERIDTAVIERLHITPITVKVQRITCPVLRLHLRDGIVTQHTCSPPAVIPRGQVTDEFLIHSAVEKVQDHLPCYRQERRLARIGLIIERNKLCRWHISLANFLEPLAEAIFDDICASPAVGIDDTVHREIVSERSTCLQGRIWAVASSAGIFYQYQRTRESQWIDALLADYSGPVIGDGYSGHNCLLARPNIIAAFCWAHARRKFFESADTRRRDIMLAHIAQLYAIESDLAAEPPGARVHMRKQRSQPVLAQIKELLTAWEKDPRVLPTSGIGRATAYVLKRWDGFTAFVDHGDIPIDNNRTEQGMRPNALHRNNSLFSASQAGAQGYATLLTVCQTAWMHHLDPMAYLNDVVYQMHHGSVDIRTLTPMRYAEQGKFVVQRPS